MKIPFLACAGLLWLAVPSHAQMACAPGDGAQAAARLRLHGQVVLLRGEQAQAMMAVYNAMPPASSVEADEVVVLLTSQVGLLFFVRAGVTCLVEQTPVGVLRGMLQQALGAGA